MLKYLLNWRTQAVELTGQFSKKAFDIRRGEGKRALLMWFDIFLIISSLLIIKPVCFSLFLLKFGVSQLPYVFILVAIFAAVMASYYSRLVKKVNFEKVVEKSLQFSIISLLFFRFLFYFETLEVIAFYLFYVWAAIFAVLITSQFWSLGNLLFNAREAKRLFGFIGSGAITGGIFGGYFTNLLAPVLGTENMLIVCMLFLTLCVFITKWIFKSGNRRLFPLEPVKVYESSPIKLLAGSRHLLLLAGIVGISVIAARLVEYQYSDIASKQIPDEDQLTAFFGFWLSNLSIISLGIQLFLTRRVVGVFGVGASLFILPVGILIGTAAVLVHPGLWSAILVKVCDGSLKQSVNKAGMELMILPIPTEIKNRAKAFIDVFVDSLGTGIGGLLLLLFTLVFNFSTRFIGLITLVLLAGWIYLVLQIREEYIRSFRLKIERPKNLEDLDSPPLTDLRNESVLGGVVKILEQGNDTRIVKTLKMVNQIQNDRLIPSFSKLLHHPSPRVRLEVLRNIYFYKNTGFTDEVREMIFDENQEIKTEAIRYLFQHSPDTRLEMMAHYLHHEDYTIRGAALLSAARESRNNQQLRKIFQVEETIHGRLKQVEQLSVENPEQAEFTRINCVRVIGAAGILNLHALLRESMKDPAPEVKKAALLGAGESQDPDFISPLVQFLGNQELQETAREALQQFGLTAIPTLVAAMEDSSADIEVRKNIPRVIAAMELQESVDVLLNRLEYPDPVVRFEIIRSLNRLRSSHPFLKFDEKFIGERILEEAREYVSILAVFYTYTRDSVQKFSSHQQEEKIYIARKNLIQALEKQLDRNLERIFRLLGLRYPPQDIYNAYLGIQSREADLRANAVEFLDSFLDPDLKRVIIPIVEATMADTLVRQTLKLFDLKPPSEKECLTMLLSGSHDELKIHALYLVARLKDTYYLPFIKDLSTDSQPRLKRMAQLAENSIAGGPLNR
jgi:AAA family ATP:ADP antiporter